MKFTLHTEAVDLLLIKQGWNRAQLSEESEVSPSAISHALNTGSCEIKTAKKIAKALGVSVQEIKRTHPAVPYIPTDLLSPTPPLMATESDLPMRIAAFVKSLTADEAENLLFLGPLLVTIYRAQKGGKDPEARRAWEYIRGNVIMFARGLEIPPPRDRMRGGDKA